MLGVRSGRLLLSLAGLLLWTVQIANAESQKPNLLIIQTDEHHFGTLGAYGSTMFGGEGSLTPHLDQLADGGAVATSFYATTPVCSPSRSSLMTGHYPQQTPVVTNDVPMSGQLQTFADLLKSAGYATGYSGKWHLDGDGKPQWAPQRNFGWSDNRYMFNRGHWKKLVLGENGPEVGSLNAKQEPSYGLDGADEKTFTTDWLADRAIEFVREHAQEPFCYMVSLPDPHGPNTVRAPYDTMYSADDVVIPASLQKTNEQIPEWGQPDRNVNEEMLKKQMPEYFGMVKCIDDNIGRILKTLDEMKIREKTMIVFTSDHGDLCGEHGKVNKGNPYEGSARIPFILNYPGVVPAGTQVDVALSCVDFLPTILDLMSCPNHLKVPGRNAADWFRGQTPDNWQDVTFLRSTSGQKVWLAAVSDRYKLVYSSGGQPWLFDLEEDPQELTNVYQDARYRKTIILLANALRAYASQERDEYASQQNIAQELTAMSEKPSAVRLELRVGESKPARGLIASIIPSNPRDRVYFRPESDLSNEDIAQAKYLKQEIDQGIEVTFTVEGSAKMLKLTEENQGKRLVILINGRVIAAPYIRAVISEKAILTGSFTPREISQIVSSMNALPSQ